MEDSGVIEAQDIRSFTWQPLPSNRIGFGA